MELLENLAGGFGPDERRWSLVPMSDKGLDVLDELRDGVEGSPADRLTGKDTKPRFDKIHPRSSGGREMKMDAGCVASQVLTSGVEWVEELSTIACRSRRGKLRASFLRKRRKSGPRWVCEHSPMTLPVATSRVA